MSSCTNLFIQKSNYYHTIEENNLLVKTSYTLKNSSCETVDNVIFLMELTPPHTLNFGEYSVYLENELQTDNVVRTVNLDDGRDLLVVPIGTVNAYESVEVMINLPICGALEERSYDVVVTVNTLVGETLTDSLCSMAKIILRTIDIVNTVNSVCTVGTYFANPTGVQRGMASTPIGTICSNPISRQSRPN